VSLRIGQFQWPLVDEGLRAIPAYDYINFSEVSRQQVLERYVRQNPGGTDESLTGFDGAISSYRDIGAMAFDEFRITEHWEGTWAAGLGNGNGINRSDNDDNRDLYLRAQAAYVFDGVRRGNPRREDVKFFAWSQQGIGSSMPVGTAPSMTGMSLSATATVWDSTTTASPGASPVSTSSETAWSTTAPIRPSRTPGRHRRCHPQMAPGKDNEFDGWYLDAAWFIKPNKLALQARYDVHNRLNSTDGVNFTRKDERVFETWSLGLQYWNHPIKSQWTLSYRIRDLEAPHNAAADEVGATMGNSIELQYFHLFNAGG